MVLGFKIIHELQRFRVTLVQGFDFISKELW